MSGAKEVMDWVAKVLEQVVNNPKGQMMVANGTAVTGFGILNFDMLNNILGTIGALLGITLTSILIYKNLVEIKQKKFASVDSQNK